MNKPIYFAVGELTHNQSELEFALQLLNDNDLKNYKVKVLHDDLVILPNQFYGI